ncbi:hypothetical protein H8D30_05435, partial [bacterium]|nr:hypothetical protein [bacterium]
MSTLFWRRMRSIDRRWIFLAMALAVMFPIIRPIGMPIRVTKEVNSLFQEMDRLAPRDIVVLAFDYGPSTAPELTPMAKAVLLHAKEKRLRVVSLSLSADAPGLVSGLLPWVTASPQEGGLGMVDGVDYTYLGYKSGTSAVILQMGQGIGKAFPKDYSGRDITDLTVMEGMEKLTDASLIIALEASAVMDTWIQYAGDQMDIPVGGGVTAVSAPEYYVFLQTNQMVGLLGGMKGAAEYETLL